MIFLMKLHLRKNLKIKAKLNYLMEKNQIYNINILKTNIENQNEISLINKVENH